MTKRYPPIPRVVQAPGGPVKIILTKDNIKYGSDECWGLYDPEHRTITIDAKAAPRQRWATFFHELTHVAILDSGLDNGLHVALHEAICDAISTQRMREKFN
jgi:Zn-dependent peptidase ImmA (M78 family)